MTTLVRDYFWTLRYLTPRQLVSRVSRPFLRSFPCRRVAEDTESAPRGVYLAVSDIAVSWEGVHRSGGATKATFLNLERRFASEVDWSFIDHGLLWNYHLHYLNWLNRYNGDSSELLGNYAKHGHGAGSSLDPYPTSLRILNTAKAFATGRIEPSASASALVRKDTVNLCRKLEYHIGANHLLENGFGLLWGGFFIDEPDAWNIGKRIVLKEMREHILDDGGHFERSPMYHAIILWRLLDTINLLRGSNVDAGDIDEGQTHGVEQILRRYASRMLAWTQAFPWSGEGEHRSGNVNDSAPGMTPSRQELVDYATRLGLDVALGTLGASGYRVLTGPDSLKLLADVGAVGPDYQPGHAHADTLAFELYHGETPILIDTGTSTYEGCPRRAWERSTRAHNTVAIGRFDSSEVWSTFRVARRARVTIREDRQQRLAASHDGYRSRFGITHTRTWEIGNDTIAIIDDLAGPGAKKLSGTASFILAPGTECHLMDNTAFVVGPVGLTFAGASSIRPEQVEVAAGFNILMKTTAIRVRFRNRLVTTISANLGKKI